MKTKLSALALLLVGLVVAASGCNQGTPAAAESSEFAPGAFPPTLSDTEYHAKAWTRSDCLSCHETGTLGAPVTEHKSLTAEAKQAKCRSCHVFIKGSKPIALVE